MNQQPLDIEHWTEDNCGESRHILCQIYDYMTVYISNQWLMCYHEYKFSTCHQMILYV